MKKIKMRYLILLLVVVLGGGGLFLYRSDTSQLAIQVKATNHLNTLLPLLPKEMKENKMLKKYPNTFQQLLQSVDIELTSHEKKTNHTGIATVKLTVPKLGKTIATLIAESNDTTLQSAINQIKEPQDITSEWLMNIVEQQIADIDIQKEESEVVYIEVATFATKANVWSFGMDAIDDAMEKVFHAMGFDAKWQKELFDQLS